MIFFLSLQYINKQMKDFKFFVGIDDEEIVWRMATGRHIPIISMTTQHIKNTICCLRGERGTTIPNPYFGKTHREWISIFTNELNNRND